MHRHRHHGAVLMSCWANASACSLQFNLSCVVLCQIVSLQYLSRSSLHRLADLPCCLFSRRLLQQYAGLFETSFVRRLRPIVSSPEGGSDECKQKMEVPETPPSFVLNDDCQIQGKAKSWGFLCVMCTYFVLVSYV